MTRRYEVLPVSLLKPAKIRELRADVLQRLKERIQKRYNPARPLSVIQNDGHYIVADGNHRLEVIKELGISEVPCVIYPPDTNIYQLAITCNEDEETYAPMDLFDWLDIIRSLRDQGLTQQAIADSLGWSRAKVSIYILLLDKIATKVLDFCRQHQEGRVAQNATTVAFNFTEGWFRNSGIYELEERYQRKLLEGFAQDKFNWSPQKVQQEAKKYKMWQEFEEIAEGKLASSEDLKKIIELIENDTFKTKEQLLQKIEDMNRKAKNKLICGDAITELEKLDDASIDLVITDPPYGIEYKSNYPKYSDNVTKNGIENDELNKALELLDKTCSILQRKTKPDAHLYIFTSWKVYPQFAQIIQKYFHIKNVLIWDKLNWNAGDLKGAWGNQYEMIIFATKGQRPLNKRRGDILRVSRIPSNVALHPTQKPVELIKQLLEVSAQPRDTVCDPFMGSGSTIKAAKEFGDLNYIGIELSKEMFEKAKAFIEAQFEEGT